MSDKILDRTDIGRFIDGLLETNRVLAPVERDGDVDFHEVHSSEDMCLEYRNTRQSAKEVLFPRCETLFTFRDGEIVPPTDLAEPQVLLGIRPCDARSMALLDRVFDEAGSSDPYYVRRRRNTVLVGMACVTPASTCFCTATGGGPFESEGLDILLTNLDDRYLVEVITARGEALVADNALLRDATDADLQCKRDLAAVAQQAVDGPETKGVSQKLDTMYDDPYWEQVHLRCLGCGVCSYLCPTCHCFDIVDEGDATSGRRVRNWDTCQFALFTHHASGHNPRPGGKERLRQRVMHKFNYFVKNYDSIACVGCGRCVVHCPVNLDIRLVIEGIGIDQ
jgi:Pyruvate/2-oxoacid:ferredoxin oxidoreductase delta subunit